MRISDTFANLTSHGEGALITYAMAGFPTMDASADVVRGMIMGGADIVELGFPFSDPLADGPAIQEAATVSLQEGTTMEKFLAMARRLRNATKTPLVAMTYANVLYNMGYDNAISQMAGAGIDGVILPDMSVEEAGPYLDAVDGRVDTIFLASPNTMSPRMRKIVAVSSGFLYLVAVYGTTGVRSSVQDGSVSSDDRTTTTATTIADHTIDAIRRAKENSAGLPVVVGFGVSSPQYVSEYVNAVAVAVIVGSAYMHLIKETPQNMLEERVALFTEQLKRAASK